MKTRYAVALMLVVLLAAGCAKESQTQDKQAKSMQPYVLLDGGMFNLEAGKAEKDINGKIYQMYAYNNQIPGPTLIVRQGSTLFINFTNNLDMNTTIHWHGIRINNQYDGVPDIIQPPVQLGESFLYQLAFPDPGVFWYHPHIREDKEQELGLYGNIIVNPTSDDYYNKVHRSANLIIDDILTKDLQFYDEYTNYALMGRYGDVFLINGDPKYNLNVKKDEVIRFFLTNVANARPMNVSFENTRMKVIGSDLSKYEREFFADSIIIAPGERYIVEAQFEAPGKISILNVNPLKTTTMGTITVLNQEVSQKINVNALKENDDVTQDIARYQQYMNQEPEYIFNLTLETPAMRMGEAEKNAIEWEDAMEGMNKAHTSRMVTWIIRDGKTGKQNMDIHEQVKKGEVKKIRIINDDASMHPMQHPMHLHGQRFLVLGESGVKNNNLVWKDTVLVPAGRYVDILVDFSNPGLWMLHCHIAEHLHSGMMAMFDVR